jgi:3-carboxy-cis,cis-muconate cycloisomerase
MPVPEFDQPGLLSPLFARGPVADAVSEDAWLRALIEVEAALARAVGEHERAEAILSSNVTLAEIADETSETASPLVGLVRRLREQAGPEVHVGATSQDIVDTATMLVLRRAVGPLLTDARAAAETCAQLARRHRDDPTIGRTLLQPALATSFGLRAARWMIGIDDAVAWLQSVHQHELVVTRRSRPPWRMSSRSASRSWPGMPCGCVRHEWRRRWRPCAGFSERWRAM